MVKIKMKQIRNKKAKMRTIIKIVGGRQKLSISRAGNAKLIKINVKVNLMKHLDTFLRLKKPSFSLYFFKDYAKSKRKFVWRVITT